MYFCPGRLRSIPITFRPIAGKGWITCHFSGVRWLLTTYCQYSTVYYVCTMYCTSLQLRPGPGPGTGRDSPAAALCGQGLSDCRRVRPCSHIGIRPAAAKSLCKKLAGCGTVFISDIMHCCTPAQNFGKACIQIVYVHLVHFRCT